ncbi:MAG: DUF6390 family protein [Actinomycetota bacterium]|nr:DUF6390 family protein [Actinomycetota bacterium]
MSTGAGMFVRFAYPPNERGYCGPADTGSLLKYGRDDAEEAGFRAVAQAFTGAYPYLELLAVAAGIPDPLDSRVVEAYWIGNDLLDRVSPTVLGAQMEELFRRSVGQFSNLALGGVTNGLAHHSFHVFCIYPWVGLLGNDRMHAHALNIVDKCRIRQGQVVEISAGRVTVESQPLVYNEGRLRLGPAVPEVTNGEVTNGEVTDKATTAAAGAGGEVTDLAVGDWVALHWDWICDRLTEQQRDALTRYTAHHLSIVNDRAAAAATVARG